MKKNKYNEINSKSRNKNHELIVYWISVIILKV